MTALPPPHVPGRYRVSFICSGNICRSPSADVVLEHQLAEAGLADRVDVASGGLGDWHVGNPMDPRSASALSDRGYDPFRHLAQQVDARPARHADVADHDLRFFAVQRVQHLARAGEAAHRELFAGQCLFEHEADRVVVVDDPDGFHAFGACDGVTARE